MIVEVDRGTGAVRVPQYVVVHDCGTVINPMILEGQIQGGVAQGIGGAYYEKLVYDQDGQLLTQTYMDYLLPTIAEVPEAAIGHLETPSPLNPLGVKGAGEAGVIPAPAAFASAIDDALGTRITEMPLSHTRLLDALLDGQDASGGGA
jgi:CO/xanthine dehydrogenase Mo-binding subunit